eukprot:SAG31_NODE_530_length_14420_cov_4.259968_6_plen_165_part_00
MDSVETDPTSVTRNEIPYRCNVSGRPTFINWSWLRRPKMRNEPYERPQHPRFRFRLYRHDIMRCTTTLIDCTMCSAVGVEVTVRTRVKLAVFCPARGISVADWRRTSSCNWVSAICDVRWSPSALVLWKERTLKCLVGATRVAVRNSSAIPDALCAVQLRVVDY